MRKVFRPYGMSAGRIRSQHGIRQSLEAGRLLSMQTTMDFVARVPARWITQESETFEGVLGNVHAVVVNGYNDDVVVIRDVLGPTNPNWSRPYEYEVDCTTC